MTEPDSRQENGDGETPSSKPANRWTGAAVAVVLMIGCVFQPTRTLLLGWISFASRVLPAMEVNWNLALIAAFALVGITILVHVLASWFCRESPKVTEATVWKFRTSVSLSLLIVIMFCAGLSAVGITHQFAWLLRSPTAWYVQKIGSATPLTENMHLANQLEYLEFGINTYDDRYERLPFVVPEDEAIPLSWPRRLVDPMHWALSLDSSTALPWNHEQNRDYYSRVFPELLNPTLENAPQHNGEGYGLSHFGANENMQHLSSRDHDKNSSNLIMIGEVRSNFEPWGKPGTHRSLELGLNRHPDGFGGPPSRDAVMFLMADGSVRAINETIDPKVLRGLSGAKEKQHSSMVK